MSMPECGLLDTSTVILLGRITDPTLLPDEPVISAITLAELSVGPLITDDSDERAGRLTSNWPSPISIRCPSTLPPPGHSVLSRPISGEPDASRRRAHTTHSLRRPPSARSCRYSPAIPGISREYPISISVSFRTRTMPDGSGRVCPASRVPDSVSTTHPAWRAVRRAP